MLAGTLELQMTANLARLADDMGKAKSMVSGTMGNIEQAIARVKSAFAALGIGLSVGYFISLIKGSIDAADHLGNLSKSTHIAVGDLAGLRLLAQQTGTDLDGLAKGINKMSVEMGKDPEKFRALGITAKDNMGAFKQMADLFNQLQDINQRNALSNAVFGKSWAEMAPVLAEGSKHIGEVVEQGKRLSGITDPLVEQAKELNDKWAALGGTGGFLTRMIGPMLPLLNSLADYMLKAQERAQGMDTGFQPLLETLKIMALGLMTSITLIKEAGYLLAGLEVISNRLAHGKIEGTGAVWNAMLEDIKKTDQELLDFYNHVNNPPKPADDTLARMNAGGGSRAGDAAAARRAAAFLAANNAAAAKTSMNNPWADAMRDLAAYIKKLEEASAPQQSMSEKLQAELDAFRGLNGELPKYLQYLVDVTKLNEDDAAYLQRQLDQEDAAIATDKATQALREQAIALRESANPLEEFSRKWQEILALRQKFPDILDDQALAAIAKKLSSEFGKSADDVTEFWRQAAHNMQDAMSSFFFDAMQGKLNNLADSFKATIDRMVANAMAANLSQYLFGNFTGGGDLGGVVGGLVGEFFHGGGSVGVSIPIDFSKISNFGGARAFGGDVFAGRNYLVGERGPEIFRAPSNGTIVPNAPASQNNADATSMTVYQTNHFAISAPVTTKTQKQLAAAAYEGAMRAARSNL